MRFLPLPFVALVYCTFVVQGFAEETYQLSQPASPAPQHVRLKLQAEGKLIVVGEQKEQKLPLSVRGDFEYDERFAAASGEQTRVLRNYRQAEAAIKIDRGEIRPVLRNNRRTIAIEAAKDEVTLSCPAGPLTREELDLLDLPCDTAVWSRLLPGRAVELGATWKHEPADLAVLLGLDAAASAEVQSALIEANAGKAKMEISGFVSGAVGGVATEVQIQGDYTFDLKRKAIAELNLEIKEQRAIGHIGPGLDVTSKLSVASTETTVPKALSNSALQSVRWGNATAKLLEYRDPSESYALRHDRRWYVMDEREGVSVFRLLEKGELLAQCNISPVKKEEAAKVQKLSGFREQVKTTLGSLADQIVSAEEKQLASGRKAFRVEVDGTSEKLPVRWVYYLTFSADGPAHVVVFTLERDLAPRFGEADADFLRSLEYRDAKRTAGR